MAIPRRRVVDVDAERVPIVATLPPLLRAFRALVGELDHDDLTEGERLAAALEYLDRAGLRDAFDVFDTFLEDQRSGVDA